MKCCIPSYSWLHYALKDAGFDITQPLTQSRARQSTARYCRRKNILVFPGEKEAICETVSCILSLSMGRVRVYISVRWEEKLSMPISCFRDKREHCHHTSAIRDDLGTEAGGKMDEVVSHPNTVCTFRSLHHLAPAEYIKWRKENWVL